MLGILGARVVRFYRLIKERDKMHQREIAAIARAGNIRRDNAIRESWKSTGPATVLRGFYP